MTDSYHVSNVHPCKESSCKASFSVSDNHDKCYRHRKCPATSSLSVNRSITCGVCRSWDQEQWKLFEQSKTNRAYVHSSRMSDSRKSKSATRSSSSSSSASKASKLIPGKQQLEQAAPTGKTMPLLLAQSTSDRGESLPPENSQMSNSSEFGRNFTGNANGLDGNLLAQSFSSQPQSAQPLKDIEINKNQHNADRILQDNADRIRQESTNSIQTSQVVAPPASEKDLLLQLLASINTVKSGMTGLETRMNTYDKGPNPANAMPEVRSNLSVDTRANLSVEKESNPVDSLCTVITQTINPSLIQPRWTRPMSLKTNWVLVQKYIPYLPHLKPFRPPFRSRDNNP